MALILGGVALYRRHAIQQRHAAEQAALETQRSPPPSAPPMRTSRSSARNCSGWTPTLPGMRSMRGCSRTTSAPRRLRQREDVAGCGNPTRGNQARDGDLGGRSLRGRVREGSESLVSRCLPSGRHASSTRHTALLTRRHVGTSGGVPRSVPACPADAERVLAGADPHIRHGAGRPPAGSLLGERRALRAVGSGLLQPLEWQRHAVRHRWIGGLLFGGMGNMFSGVGEGVR